MRVRSYLLDGLAALAYPAQCRVCGSPVSRYDDGVACHRCWEDPEVTRFFAAPMCARCGLPLAGKLRSTERTCGACDAFPFRAARACGAYVGALEASILYLKAYPHLCRRLRQLVANTFAEQHSLLVADVIVPVPLHRNRLRERGYNQADLIARGLARSFSIPSDSTVLIRIKETERHRIGLDAKDRAASVRRAFHVEMPETIAGRSVLLIDDVFTTGSTLSSAATALIDSGAAHVNVLTIARVPSHSYR